MHARLEMFEASHHKPVTEGTIKANRLSERRLYYGSLSSSKFVREADGGPEIQPDATESP